MDKEEQQKTEIVNQIKSLSNFALLDYLISASQGSPLATSWHVDFMMNESEKEIRVRLADWLSK